jgi:hypothetical protein
VVLSVSIQQTSSFGRCAIFRSGSSLQLTPLQLKVVLPLDIPLGDWLRELGTHFPDFANELDNPSEQISNIYPKATFSAGPPEKSLCSVHGLVTLSHLVNPHLLISPLRLRLSLRPACRQVLAGVQLNHKMRMSRMSRSAPGCDLT